MNTNFIRRARYYSPLTVSCKIPCADWPHLPGRGRNTDQHDYRAIEYNSTFGRAVCVAVLATKPRRLSAAVIAVLVPFSHDTAEPSCCEPKPWRFFEYLGVVIVNIVFRRASPLQPLRKLPIHIFFFFLFNETLVIKDLIVVTKRNVVNTYL